MLNWLQGSVPKWLRREPERTESIVICGPLGTGKRTILNLIAADATLIPDPTGMNRKLYTSKIYPTITFGVWDHVCAPGMLFKPEWPEYLPLPPTGLILVLNVNDIPLFRTIRDELYRLLASQHLRSSPTLILLNKSDIETDPNDFLTVERVHRDLRLTELYEKGLKTYVLRSSRFKPEKLNDGLRWLNGEVKLDSHGSR